MKQFTDEEIIAKVESLPTFKGWQKGIYDVWVRSSADEYDAFDDKAYTFEVEEEGEQPKFIMVRRGTTNTGSFGLMNFEDWNTKGCAVLKSDVIVYGSHKWGKHKSKDAYRQAKGFPYYRDNNKNRRAEEIGKEYNDIIYANVHRAGQHSTTIKNWSVGCLVTADLDKFMKFLDFMKSKGKPPLNVAILKENTVPSVSFVSKPKVTENGDVTITESEGEVVIETPETEVKVESTEAKVTVWDKLKGWTEKINIVSAFKDSFTSISFGSKATFLSTKLLGWLLMALGFFVDHWLWFVGAVLIAVAIWYFAGAKNRANERELKK